MYIFLDQFCIRAMAKTLNRECYCTLW